MTIRDSVLEEILEERKHQDKKWGGANHDDHHGPYAWVAFITNYLGQAVGGLETEQLSKAQLRSFRYNMLKVAALAVAAVEMADRKLSDD